MAERRVQLRQGRRDKRKDGDGDAAEVKRRSRSEGPSGRRITQSMDVGSNNNAGRRANNGNASFEQRDSRGISKVDRDSSLGSDDGGGAVNPDPSGSDSDSESDRMQWTKNPLKVRKVKKNNVEKRNAGSANNANNNANYTQLGQRSTNRESWVYLAPEGTPLPTSPMQQQKADNGSSSGSLKNKYQKLEEMRKKRIDIAMTSDEENTPESRISRLRQRALQGALGSSARTDNSRAIVSDHNNWGRSGARTGSAVMSDQGTRQPNVQPANHYGNQSVVSPQPQAYRSSVVVTSQSASRAPQQQAVYQAASHRQTLSAQPVSVHGRVGQGRGQSPQLITTSVKQGLVRPFTDSGTTEVASAGNTGRQQFYTIPEPQVGSRVVHNSSPEINVRRFKPAVRIPSADSIYDGVNSAQDSYEVSRPGAVGRTVVSGRVFAQVNPPSQDVVEVQRGTALQSQLPANLRQPGAPKFNEVVELRLRSSRVIDRPLSQTFEDRRPQSPRRRDDVGFRSEDSLDELIESNIQYLEKEFKQGGSKKLQVPVSRSSSLPDPRKSAALVSKPQVTVSGQHIARTTAQASTPVLNNKSELHFRVPLPPQTSAQTTPRIHIADENQWADSVQPASNSYTFGVVPRAERKHSYDSRTRSSRPTSEHYDRDEVSKSDTQLNAAVVQPTYRGAMLHPSHVPGRGYVSDQNLTVDQAQGMFSDVDYDIEVSERVKKWETYMKKPDFVTGGEVKKPIPLTPIEERTEGDRDSLMVPSEIRKSIRMGQQPQVAVNPPSNEQQLSLVSMKPANSDPLLHVTGDARVLSKETNLHRFFQVVQDPSAGPHLSQSTSSIYIDLPHQGPHLYSHTTTVYQPGGLMSANQLRQHMLANQRSHSEANRSSAAPQLALGYDEAAASIESPDRKQRLSRYQDEIEEMKTVKQQSVSNLRRRFDEGKTTTSEDESRHEFRVAKVSPTQKEGSNVSWSQMITGLEDKIRDMEVWSPSMESTQGNVVSIERVKARTLQTIPFSEDPFWKEIEEMTTFDPNSLGGHLSASEEIIKPSTTQPVDESPHSSTLPSQPRLHSAMSMKERMQRSKSLYTPNITPLTINVEPYSAGKTSSLERGSSTDKYSGPSALDEVLEDIRTSLERKPLSPKRKAVVESSDSLRSSPGPSQSSEILRARLDRERAKAHPVGHTEVWNNLPNTHAPSHIHPPMSITISSSVKPAPPVSGAMPPGVGMTTGHYHLDPHLLSQKLLSTGLVEEDHKPQPPVRSHMPVRSLLSMSKPVAVAPPQTVARSVVAPTQRAATSVTITRPTAQQSDKLSQVTNSMEDLRQLAVNVERKINAIKSRLVTADDQNLDKILLALRKFSPSAGPHSPDIQPSNMQDFYHSKKNKLEDALRELERIQVSLDLGNDMLKDGAERRDYSSYRTKPLRTTATVSSTSVLGSAANPSRLMSSSTYNSPVSVATVYSEASPYDQGQRGFRKSDIDKQAQSEFDVISKSFQAIIDEVNKTASLVSSASTPQPRPRNPLPEIKELQSKLYASKEQEVLTQLTSPESTRRPLNVTFISQQDNFAAVPTPKSPPPVVAPKPSLRCQVSVSESQQPASSPSQQSVAGGISIVTSSIQMPITSVVQAEMVQPASDMREPPNRGRFRPKAANQEKEDAAAKRARSKSSPSITLQDLASANEGITAGNEEQQHTAKTQLSFQLEPPGASGGSRKPPLKLDVARAQQGSIVELQLKPPVMFQDGVNTMDKTSGAVVAQNIIRPLQDSAPPPEGKTLVFPETPTTTSVTLITASSSATQQSNQPTKADMSSSESSAEGRDKKGKKMGRGVAMMVELFSSSDEERLRRSHPLHTRSAPDLSGDIPSDDSFSLPKNLTNIRPAEITRLKQNKAETSSAQSSPAAERKRMGGGQNEGVGSPQSPSNKPPFHPFRRQQPSPDRTTDNSPQRAAVAFEPQAADIMINGESANTASAATVVAAVKVTPRVRAGSSRGKEDVPERPRSFHELLSTFEPDQQRLNKLRSQGKCASEEVLPEQVVVARVFRASQFTSEPDLRSQRHTAPTPQEVRQWTL